MLYIIKRIDIVINFHWTLEMTSNCELKTLQFIIGKLNVLWLASNVSNQVNARSIFHVEHFPRKAHIKKVCTAHFPSWKIVSSDILRVIIASLSPLCRTLCYKFYRQAKRELKEVINQWKSFMLPFNSTPLISYILARHIPARASFLGLHYNTIPAELNCH